MPDSRYKNRYSRKNQYSQTFYVSICGYLNVENVEKTHSEQRLYLRENRKASKLVEVRLQMQTERMLIIIVGKKGRVTGERERTHGVRKKKDQNKMKNQQHDEYRKILWSNPRDSNEQQIRSTP